jgi:hypothetical protein
MKYTFYFSTLMVNYLIWNFFPPKLACAIKAYIVNKLKEWGGPHDPDSRFPMGYYTRVILMKYLEMQEITSYHCRALTPQTRRHGPGQQHKSPRPSSHA